MKKVLLSVAVAALGFAATSCQKSYNCDCTTWNTGVPTYSTSTVKGKNATEAEYTCETNGTAPGATNQTNCHLR
ncbi:MAG: hypothetical protein JST67_03970 [Bacteroidetes bacterium]|nr:hypothetical protein [Bacteroidota bacterium]